MNGEWYIDNFEMISEAAAELRKEHAEQNNELDNTNE